MKRTNPSLPAPLIGPGAGIDLRTILNILRYWRWLLLIGVMVGGGLGYAVSLQTTPIYRASILLLIEEIRSATNNPTSTSLGNERISTYLELINQELILKDVASELQVDLPQLEASIADMRVEQVRTTQLFTLIVDGYSADYAAAVANTLPQALENRIKQVRTTRFAESKTNLKNQLDTLKTQIDLIQIDIDRFGVARSSQEENRLAELQTRLGQYQSTYANLTQSYENLRLIEIQSLDNIAIVKSAEIPEQPVSSNRVANTLLGILIGLAAVLAAITLIEYLDDRFRSVEDMQQTLNTPLLGSIAAIRLKTTKEKPINPSELGQFDCKLITANKPRHPVSEAYRSLRTNLRFSNIDAKLQSLIITSPEPGEGKSLTAANLAIVMAQLGLSVVLVDADLRKPTQHKLFFLPQQPGLSDSLLLEDAAPWQYLHELSVPNLRILTSGKEPPNPAELLGSQRMQQLIQQLHTQADVVLIDTPPILAVTDSAVLTNHIKEVVMVINAQKTRRSTATRAIESFLKVDAHLLGVVMNEVNQSARGYGYSNYGYGEYYGAAHE